LRRRTQRITSLSSTTIPGVTQNSLRSGCREGIRHCSRLGRGPGSSGASIGKKAYMDGRFARRWGCAGGRASGGARMGPMSGVSKSKERLRAWTAGGTLARFRPARGGPGQNKKMPASTITSFRSLREHDEQLVRIQLPRISSLAFPGVNFAAVAGERVEKAIWPWRSPVSTRRTWGGTAQIKF
jgi:hypothetical protein